ncbi:MAG: methylenetetrahydrofolate--tRNA-(uracil(54)-C(5))-methyltransferase (FADH(2)-oxidizing) TrmFO [Myxococcales bacterium]|nr:methylenetetrahydrofolate--tRNA-(uracil(54)-C(5))-methyltransferase (FADH(2)-oxidizing) TrmFO [Myxococcales bacterium]
MLGAGRTLDVTLDPRPSTLDYTHPSVDLRSAITVVGGGLAGSECAFQLARLGVEVCLVEMKPGRRSPAHRGDGLAELVCSNSLRSDEPETAVGLLHEELRRLSSVVLGCADQCRVPAGGALAVDREAFSDAVTRTLSAQPRVRLARREVERLPEGVVVVATGPLTSEPFAAELGRHVGERLYFYDAIAPIVDADSVDRRVAFRMSRYGKGGGDDYLNLPLEREQYLDFVSELRAAEKVSPRAFEEPRYFEGCLPIEVMAERGDEVLAHGPMRPVGLLDPRTGRRPHAVVQLRAEDRAGTAYNLVGFQTRLTWPEQRRLFRQLPGLEGAEFLRLGQIHRNTFIDSPRLLLPDLSLRSEPRILFAGQISGVEGYVESAASGLLVALSLHARLSGRKFLPPPATTALGALYRHVTGEAHPEGLSFQPTNVTFGLFPPLPGRVRKADKRVRYAQRAREDLEAWTRSLGLPIVPGDVEGDRSGPDQRSPVAESGELHADQRGGEVA